MAVALGAPKPAAAAPAAGFDVVAHRGGAGETTEESLRAFAKSLELGLAHWNSTLASPRTINLWCGTTRRSSPASAPTPRRRSPATRNIPTSESWCTNSPWRKSACLTAANCSASSRMRKLCGQQDRNPA
ncbi:glycerophosphodiester phosphodiesterase domain protein [Mycobacterium xenopi 3993]|nr:glycerophosphodiester phosphodiesterase domain protein [Mycobacterium xenopi 3993]